MGIIYIITNNNNGKQYIGQTKRDIQERWKEHKSKSMPSDGTYLHNAIHKYGYQNFDIQILRKVPDESLNRLEQFFIRTMKTYWPNGYNLTLGGDGNQKINKQEIINCWNQGMSLQQIAESLNISKNTVIKYLSTYENYDYKEAIQRQRKLNPQHHGINQYDWQGNFIKHYESALEVTNNDKYKANHVCKACRGVQKMWHNYQWRYDTDPPPGRLENPEFSSRKIVQFDLDDNILQIFNSAADAARSASPQQNPNMVSGQIIQVCKGNRKTAKGYKWKYYDDVPEIW